jgi:glyoxylase-like metal-dependent hydrolase (beta-lactamase superfamily II)
MKAAVHILYYGSHMSLISDLISGGGGLGEKIETPSIGLFINHPKGMILVDTGWNDVVPEVHRDMGHVYSLEHTPLGQLQKLGVKPRDISHVVLTHMHFDHVGGIQYFQNIPVLVRRSELEKAFVPPRNSERLYLRSDFDIKGVAYETIDGDMDYEILPGVTLISTPGHSAGSQSILIESKEGSILYAGDAIYLYENWEKGLMPGICYSQALQLQTFSRLKGLGPFHLIPGHDPKVDVKKVYEL